MAVDSDAIGNGVIVSAVYSGMEDSLNTAPDQTSIFVQANIVNQPIDIAEVEDFRRKGSSTGTITFQQTLAHSAETWFMHVTYEIFPPKGLQTPNDTQST